MLRKSKIFKYGLWIVFVFSPFILMLILSKIWCQNIFLARPFWSDEVGYWREIYSFAECGFKTGYIGINELIPKVGQFSTHSFFPAFFYYPFAKILNWPVNGIVISNLIFIIVCFALVIVIYKPNISQTLMLTCLYSFFSPVLLFVETSMTEILNYGFLALFFVLFYKYLSSEGKRRKYFLILTILAGTICSFYRITYVVLLILPVLVLSDFKLKKFTALLLPYGIYSGLLYLVTSIFTAPYQLGVLYKFTHSSSIFESIKVILINCKSNIRDLFSITNGYNLEAGFRLLYVIVLAIYLFCIFLNITVKKSFLVISLKEKINKFYIIQFVLLFLPLIIVIVIYDMHTNREVRVLAPFLWASFFNLIIYKKTLSLKIFKPIFAMFFIFSMIVWPKNFYMNNERYSNVEKRDFTLIKNVVQYESDASDPFKNTISTNVAFDFELWSSLDPGIGIQWLTSDFELEDCKSKYLLINKDKGKNEDSEDDDESEDEDIEIAEYEIKGKTDFGYLYVRKGAS